MNGERAAVTLGILGNIIVLGVVVVPYLFAPGSVMSVYYASWYGGPPLIALFSVVGSIVFLAGYKHRTDTAVSAGIVTVLGAFMVILSLAWAINADPATIGGFTNNTLFRYHSWTLPIMSFIVTIAGGWYARLVL